MVPDISYFNFSPPTELADHFARRLAEFSEFCADESYINATVRKEKNIYYADVSVRHPHGHMAVRSQNIDLRALFVDCMDSLFEQIRVWRKSRFIEPFKMGTHSEADNFGEYEESEADRLTKPARVLIVEDDPGSMTVLNTIFQKAGYDTELVTDAFKAVREMSGSDYDLVVLDWYLPYMDGAEVITRAEASIRGRDKKGIEKTVPVITCSGISKEQIQIPDTKHFRFIDHWDKALPFSSILNHAIKLLPTLRESRV